MPAQSLRDVVADADAARFVGRSTERHVGGLFLARTSPHRVLFVHGPAGIGKSALVRMIARDAVGSGYHVHWLDLQSGSRGLDRHLARLVDTSDEQICVIVDQAERFGSELDALRDRLIDALPSTARIVFAHRASPGPSWRLGGLDAVLVELPLGPLPTDDALRILEAGGADAALRPTLADWAHGSPLALTVAALAPHTTTLAPLAETLEARLTSWITGSDDLGVAKDVLEVAAIAPVFDARLLAAALPSRATRDGMAQLTSLPVVESIGDRAVLHPVLARAVEARLEQFAPERHRLLKRRIVEHLGSRARLGDITALIEVSQFISDPRFRAAIANTPSSNLFTDAPQDGDLDAFAATEGFDAGDDWDEIVAWAREAAHHLVVRRANRQMVFYAVFARVDALEVTGPVTHALAAAAHASGADPTKSFVGVVCFADDSDDEERTEAARLGSGALMHLHGIPDMQAVLIHYPEPDRRPTEALSVIAHPFVGALRRQVAFSDFRPGGAVGFVEAIVLGELGFPPRTVDHADLLVSDDDPDREARLIARLDEVFDDSTSDQRLRRVVELAHLGPRRSEAECLETLHVSRRTWFRLLRTARERVLN